MQFYLPIAEISVNLFIVLGLGTTVGVLSGIFGVGGGFILTPLLFFIGIPPGIAVGTQGTLIVASSFSALLNHLKKRTVDFPMGALLLVGGLVGSTIGVRIFHVLTALGQVDLLISLCYVVLLGIVGGLMFREASSAFLRRRSNTYTPARRKRHTWTQGLPIRVRFRASQMYVSAIPPFAIGVGVGILSAIMGVGGGFMMLPAMIYIIGMPTKVVVGTSLFQITLMSAYTTLMHATQNHTVDFVLGFFLLVGGVVGAQIGSRIGARLPADVMRMLLALMVLSISVVLAVQLALEPAEHFALFPI